MSNINNNTIDYAERSRRSKKRLISAMDKKVKENEEIIEKIQYFRNMEVQSNNPNFAQEIKLFRDKQMADFVKQRKETLDLLDNLNKLKTIEDLSGAKQKVEFFVEKCLEKNIYWYD